jgi:hypothetical protein
MTDHLRVWGHGAAALMVLASAGCGAAPSSGAGAAADYSPDVAFAYDGQYLDGSFEGLPGFGWDRCFTRTPGVVTQANGGASEGNDFVLLASSAACSGACGASQPSASQLYLWFKARPSATAAASLYFDVRNAGEMLPSGSVQIYGTDSGCEGETLLAEAPLDRLEMSSSWATRCITLAGPGAYAAIGVALTGGPHSIGLDALRFGPPCHSP